MLKDRLKPQWKKRLAEIDSPVDALRLPKPNADSVAQDEEWCEVIAAGEKHRLRFHDYDKIYEIPGLYEQLFYAHLKCTSPSRIAHLLIDVIEDFEDDPNNLRVFDVGAGNGMVGDELRVRHVSYLIGADIIPEARQAARRDRPGVYQDYRVVDLTDLPEHEEQRLRSHSLNCLTCVAALGFDDIPPQAFIKALDLIETPGWMGFTIKEDFLHEEDSTGFARLIRTLSRERIVQTQAFRRYRHRVSITGEPLYYVAMIARKLADVPDGFLETNGS